MNVSCISHYGVNNSSVQRRHTVPNPKVQFGFRFRLPEAVPDIFLARTETRIDAIVLKKVRPLLRCNKHLEFPNADKKNPITGSVHPLPDGRFIVHSHFVSMGQADSATAVIDRSGNVLHLSYAQHRPAHQAFKGKVSDGVSLYPEQARQQSKHRSHSITRIAQLIASEETEAMKMAIDRPLRMIEAVLQTLAEQYPLPKLWSLTGIKKIARQVFHSAKNPHSGIPVKTVHA